MMSDDCLESELKDIKNGQFDDKQKCTISTQESIMPEKQNQNFPKILPINLDKSGISLGRKNFLHPLKALLYLKLLCVHPCLVTSQKDYPAYHEHLKVRT